MLPSLVPVLFKGLRIPSKNDEMDKAYGTFAGEEKFMQDFGAETCRVDVKDLGVDGRIST
jgi:hypothetical protein